MNSRPDRTCGRLVPQRLATFALAMLLCGVGVAAEPTTRVSQVIPRRDAEIDELLRQFSQADGWKEATRKLAEVPKDRLRGGLASALIRAKTWRSSLLYLMASPPDASMLPWMLDGAKWSDGWETLHLLALLEKSRDEQTIPNMLEWMVNDGFRASYGDRASVGPLGHVAFLPPTPSISDTTAMLLYSLTRGAIGIEKEPHYSCVSRSRIIERANEACKWRQWWHQNHAKILPEWRPDDIGTNEADIRKWCESKNARFGEQAVGEVKEAFKRHVEESRRGSAYVFKRDLISFTPQADLRGPVSTAVLIQAVLDAAAQMPADAPALGPEPVLPEAVLSHRIGLLHLSKSREYGVVCQFFLWGLRTVRIKDLRAAAWTLGHIPRQEAVEALELILQRNIAPEAMEDVAVALGRSGLVEAVAPLVKILAGPQSDTIANKATDSLYWIGDRSNWRTVVEAVAPLLVSGNRKTALAALIVMGRCRDAFGTDGATEAMDALRSALPKMAEDLKPTAEQTLKELQKKVERSKQ